MIRRMVGRSSAAWSGEDGANSAMVAPTSGKCPSTARISSMSAATARPNGSGKLEAAELGRVQHVQVDVHIHRVRPQCA